MPAKNANYYSVKPGRPESLKSHRTRNAAMKNAGESGVIWDMEAGQARQIHEMSNGTLKGFKPDDFLAMDIKKLIDDAGLID